MSVHALGALHEGCRAAILAGGLVAAGYGLKLCAASRAVCADDPIHSLRDRLAVAARVKLEAGVALADAGWSHAGRISANRTPIANPLVFMAVS